jgi:hypothetical protein
MAWNQVGLGKPSDKERIGKNIAPGIIASILAVFIDAMPFLTTNNFPRA